MRVKLLGGFHVCFDNGQLCGLPTRKSEALLAFLALPAGRFHPRDKLAALLWGDTGEAQARQSLRQALGSLRRVCTEGGRPIMLTRGDSIALDPAAVTVDVTDVERALSDGRVESLEAAVLLYEGDLLAGLRVSAPAFEEWRTVERERLHELVLEALVKLLREQARTDRLDSATQTAVRILAIDPLQEAVHRALMRLLLRQGRRAAALQQYQTCITSLQRELGADPEDETRQLYRDILRTTRPSLERSTSVPSVPAMLGGSATGRAAETAMVGRDVELAHLRGAFARMLDNGGEVALITGEAGIGKSRLIQEFVASEATQVARISFGRCHETEQTLPFRPWIDALRSDGVGFGAIIRERLGTAASVQLATLFPELEPRETPSDVSATPALFFDPLVELVEALASEQPLVIVIEDLHWSDTMSARFLAFLGRRLARTPVLVVASMRPEELIDAPVLAQAVAELRAGGRMNEMALRPLSEAQTRTLVLSLHPTRARRDTERAAAEIWELSAGNPFVVVESVRALHDAFPPGPRVAKTVQDFVAARLERLGTLPRHIVSVAATVGRDCSFALLTRAAQTSEHETADAVEELVRRRILETVGDHLDFCHDWIRSVAYERMLAPQRASLHAAVGAALQEAHKDRLDDVADQLGHHYFRAGDGRMAVQHLARFAWLAALRYALDDSCRAYDQAMAAVEHLPPPERDRAHLDVALRKAFVLSIAGRQREILELLQTQAHLLKRVVEPSLIAEYHFRLGLTQFFLGEHAQSQRAGEQALQEAERSESDELIGKALHVLSLCAFEGGRPHDGIAHATRAIPLLLDQPESDAWRALLYHDLAINCLLAGALDAAIDAAMKEETIGRKRQWHRIQALATYVQAWALALRGDDETAVETARRSLDLARDPMVTSLASGTLGLAYLEQGAADSAVAFLTRALDQFKQGPLKEGEGRYLALLSEAYLLAGDVARARDTVAAALALSEGGRRPLNIGIAQRAAGRIAYAGGDLDEAERRLSQALETFLESGAAFEVARTRVDLAAARGKREDGDGARAYLAAALATFEAANAPKRAAAVGLLARSLGVTLTAG